MPRRQRPRRPPTPGAAAPANLAKARAARAYQSGDPGAALALANQASASLKRDHELLHLQAACLAQLGDPNAALDKLERALRLRPGEPKLLVSLAETYRALQRFEEMDAAIDRALRLEPARPDAVYLKAQALRQRGRLDDARAVVERALARAADDPALLMAHAELCRASGEPEPGIDSARRAADSPAARPDVARSARFLLGKLLDAAARYDEAFDEFERANAGLAAPRVTEADRIIARWSAERLAAVPTASERTELPVLVCGMPRTGTTLVEQMLAAHPSIGTVGESVALPEIERAHNPVNLDQRTVDELRDRYLAALAQGARRGETRVVDKLPTNYARLGLASRIAPGCRVLCCRRDPRDTCLSCYTQGFFGDSHPYAHDLAACARQYAEHLKVMAHWRRVLDTPILEVRYERLVREPEPVVREMLDFLALDFDGACLRHHETDRAITTHSSDQARRPVYRSSIARWRNYESRLAPLIDALREHGVSLDGD